jgi:hypothetical protein
MSSWANRMVVPGKKQGPTISSYYEPSDDYFSSTVAFFYWSVYQQRTAEPFYIHDTKGFFQPLLTPNPTFHYIKEVPSSASKLESLRQTGTVLTSLSAAFLRRAASSLLQFNGQTNARIDSLLLNSGVMKDSFDAGIVLDVSGCVPHVINSLHGIQKRLAKKTLRVFVASESLSLVEQFARTGDPSWSFVSLLRKTPPDAETLFWKRLAEFKVLRSQENLVVRLESPLGSLLYLTASKIQLDSQIVSWDGSRWKAGE